MTYIASPEISSSVTIIQYWVKSFFILAVMGGLLYMVLKKTSFQNMSGQKNMRIVEKLVLDVTSSLYLVEIGDAYQLIATSTKTIQVLAQYKKSELKLKKNSLPPTTDFAGLLKNINLGKLKKGAVHVKK